MSHADFFNLSVDRDSVGQHTERVVRQVVVGHVDLLKISHLDQVVGEGLHLSIRKSALD